MIKTQMEMYLHEELETLTRTEIEALQFERLLRTVRRCMKSPFYQKRFAEAHLWGIERSGFFNGREKWAKGFENQRV